MSGIDPGLPIRHGSVPRMPRRRARRQDAQDDRRRLPRRLISRRLNCTVRPARSGWLTAAPSSGVWSRLSAGTISTVRRAAPSSIVTGRDGFALRS